MDSVRNYTHTWQSIFYMDLSIALVLAFSYHILVRNSLILNLPTALRERLQPYNHFNWIKYFDKHFPIVIASIITGSLSHLLWDGFTHQRGWFVQRSPWMLAQIRIAQITLPLFLLLQYLSSVIGLVAIGYFIKILPRINSTNRKHDRTFYWLTAGFVSTAVFTYKLWSTQDMQSVNTLIFFFSSCIIGIITAPLLLRLIAKINNRPL